MVQEIKKINEYNVEEQKIDWDKLKEFLMITDCVDLVNNCGIFEIEIRKEEDHTKIDVFMNRNISKESLISFQTEQGFDLKHINKLDVNSAINILKSIALLNKDLEQIFIEMTN